MSIISEKARVAERKETLNEVIWILQHHYTQAEVGQQTDVSDTLNVIIEEIKGLY